ncbi:hypothetical protein QFC22_005051 [Naganishia vaughanmartiniae]|uniref:Uncharacterized protein n=1 Tax=Naganishia vaughanmartiniae TaxID=1424756 RepID=A0ACC2WWR9_9TREE|nr:hypothetical protein QFC22_005051 [Naganishia vaughanmartiniae]
MTTNAQLLFNQIPKGEPTPETFKYNTENKIDLEQKLDNGAHIVKIICVSLDPYMRGRMRPAEVKSYSPAFELHKPLTGHGVGVVIRAAADSQYKVGDHVYGMVPYQQFVLIPGQQKVDEESKKFLGPQVGLRVIKNEEGLPWSAYIGAAGMPGKTAFMAWKEIADAKKGEVAFISAGSGPVGQMAIQLAKADGLKVISSAGSDEKVAFLKELGADVAFNCKLQSTSHKTDDAKKIFAEHGPIDVNWVNVGGKSFEEELEFMNMHGRLIGGWISAYNGESYGVRNLFQFVAKRLMMRGFIVGDFEASLAVLQQNINAKYVDDFYATIPKKLAFGDLKFKECKYDGLESAPKAFLEMLAGKQSGGFGKVFIQVAADDSH